MPGALLLEIPPHIVAMVQPADLVGEESASVGQDHAEARKPFEDPAQDQARGGQRGLGREAHEVPEVIVLHTARVAPVLGMDEERHRQPLRRREHRRQARVVQIHAVDVRADLEPSQAELRHAPVELASRPRAVLHGEHAEAEEPVGMGPDQPCNPVVHRAGDALRHGRIGPAKEQFGRRPEGRRVQLSPVQPREDPAVVVEIGAEGRVGLDGHAGRRVVDDALPPIAGLDLDRLAEPVGPDRLDERQRHHVEVDVDRFHGSDVSLTFRVTDGPSRRRLAARRSRCALQLFDARSNSSAAWSRACFGSALLKMTRSIMRASAACSSG